MVMENVRSRHSQRHAYVRFINKSNRKVDVIWINYEGVKVKYKTLEPSQSFDITSFVSHPWIFRDSETHTKLKALAKEVYDCPEPVYVRLQGGVVRPTRSIVNITLPLYSLRDIALEAIQKCIKDPEDVYELEIPKTLQDDLYHRCSLSTL